MGELWDYIWECWCLRVSMTAANLQMLQPLQTPHTSMSYGCVPCHYFGDNIISVEQQVFVEVQPIYKCKKLTRFNSQQTPPI